MQQDFYVWRLMFGKSTWLLLGELYVGIMFFVKNTVWEVNYVGRTLFGNVSVWEE